MTSSRLKYMSAYVKESKLYFNFYYQNLKKKLNIEKKEKGI